MANRKKRNHKELTFAEKEQRLKTRLHQDKKQRKLGLRPALKALLETETQKTLKEKKETGLSELYRLHQGLKRGYPKGEKTLVKILEHPKFLFSELRYYIQLARAFLNLKIHRDLKLWKIPRSKDDFVLFRSLFFYLLVQYKLPPCMEYVIYSFSNDNVFMTEEKIMFEMARGRGIHQVINLEVEMNSKMNFYFNDSPGKLQLSAAMWWARLRSRKVSSSIALQLVNNLHIDVDSTWENWLDDFVFFINRFRDIGKKDLKKILDFILCQKKEGKELHIPNYEESVKVPPLYPDFTFKGRSPASTLRFVAEWEQFIQLAREAGVNKRFNVSSVPPMRIVEGGSQILIQQITNLRNLVREGNQMNHCVATYASYCISGESSIWSMSQISPSGKKKKLLTIEVREADQTIEEIRGKSNRIAKRRELAWIDQWKKEFS